MTVKGCEILQGTNCIKNVGPSQELAKARYVVQGYNHRMKLFVVHYSPTLRKPSRKIIVSCASLLEFHVCLLNTTQAYLQSKSKLKRPVYIKSKQRNLEHFNVSLDKLL